MAYPYAAAGNSVLYNITYRVLPVIALILFVISLVVIWVDTIQFHLVLPVHWVIGFSVTFIIIAACAVLGLAVLYLRIRWKRQRDTRRDADGTDVEKLRKKTSIDGSWGEESLWPQTLFCIPCGGRTDMFDGESRRGSGRRMPKSTNANEVLLATPAIQVPPRATPPMAQLLQQPDPALHLRPRSANSEASRHSAGIVAGDEFWPLPAHPARTRPILTVTPSTPAHKLPRHIELKNAASTLKTLREGSASGVVPENTSTQSLPQLHGTKLRNHVPRRTFSRTGAIAAESGSQSSTPASNQAVGVKRRSLPHATSGPNTIKQEPKRTSRLPEPSVPPINPTYSSVNIHEVPAQLRTGPEAFLASRGPLLDPAPEVKNLRKVGTFKHQEGPKRASDELQCRTSHDDGDSDSTGSFGLHIPPLSLNEGRL